MLPAVKRTPVVFVAAFALALPLGAQSAQSLPNGWMNTDATGATAFTVNNANSSKWQWHYDSSNFVATGPIVITEISVRASTPTAVVNAFSFPSFVVTLASSPTDYSVAGNGVQSGHSTTFAANLNADATVVRTGPFTGGPVPASGGTTATWVPIGLTGQFVYDPSLGNDFVVQIEKCGSTATWGASLDGPSGGAGLILGNRYGEESSCTATVSTFQNNEFVPVIKIDYLEDNRLSVTQSGPGVGDLSLSLVSTSPGAIEGWILLSADVSHPASSGPALGIYPDLTTWSILFGTPIADGNPLHFFIPSQLGLFPNVPFQVAPGGVSFLAGLTFDFTGAVFGPGPVYLGRMNVVRHTFQ
jgi:hypothetical protein